MLVDDGTGHSVVGFEQVPPFAVAEGRGSFGRANDVGEEDGCKGPVRFRRTSKSLEKRFNVVEGLGRRLRVESRVATRHRDKACPDDVVGQIFALFDRVGLPALAVKHEAGNSHRSQYIAHGHGVVELQASAVIPGAQRLPLTHGEPVTKGRIVRGIGRSELGHCLSSPSVLEELHHFWAFSSPTRRRIGENQAACSCRMCGGEENGSWTPVERSQEHSALRGNRIEHSFSLIGPSLPTWERFARWGIRGA